MTVRNARCNDKDSVLLSMMGGGGGGGGERCGLKAWFRLQKNELCTDTRGEELETRLIASHAGCTTNRSFSCSVVG